MVASAGGQAGPGVTRTRSARSIGIYARRRRSLQEPSMPILSAVGSQLTPPVSKPQPIPTPPPTPGQWANAPLVDLILKEIPRPTNVASAPTVVFYVGQTALPAIAS